MKEWGKLHVFNVQNNLFVFVVKEFLFQNTQTYMLRKKYLKGIHTICL